VVYNLWMDPPRTSDHVVHLDPRIRLVFHDSIFVSVNISRDLALTHSI
jgi:hypothetical protein